MKSAKGVMAGVKVEKSGAKGAKDTKKAVKNSFLGGSYHLWVQKCSNNFPTISEQEHHKIKHSSFSVIVIEFDECNESKIWWCHWKKVTNI